MSGAAASRSAVPLAGSPLAQFGLAIILFWVLVAVFAPWLAPFPPNRSLQPMAFPGATIYVLTEDGPVPSRFEDLEHVRLTRDFLANPDSYLRHLLDPT